MGLDMYAKTAPRHTITAAVDFEIEHIEELEDLHYWRKHPNLHGFMCALYAMKGGASDDFNCNTLLVTLPDLDLLEEMIHKKALPTTTGFFFGESDGSEVEDDLAFVAKARAAIAAGKGVIYYAWW